MVLILLTWLVARSLADSILCNNCQGLRSGGNYFFVLNRPLNEDCPKFSLGWYSSGVSLPLSDGLLLGMFEWEAAEEKSAEQCRNQNASLQYAALDCISAVGHGPLYLVSKMDCIFAQWRNNQCERGEADQQQGWVRL